jgi:hypothetical protein
MPLIGLEEADYQEDQPADLQPHNGTFIVPVIPGQAHSDQHRPYHYYAEGHKHHFDLYYLQGSIGFAHLGSPQI